MSQDDELLVQLRTTELYEILQPFVHIGGNKENRLVFKILLKSLAKDEEQCSRITIDIHDVELVIGKLKSLLDNPWTRLVKTEQCVSILETILILCRNENCIEKFLDHGLDSYLNLLLENGDDEEIKFAAKLITSLAAA